MGILVDTNVISEVMRPNPSGNVISWLNSHNITVLFISSITIAEICYGLRILAEGQRRQSLQSRFEQFISQGFAKNILNFNEPAARTYAEIMGMRKEKGRPMSLPDGQIAAIAQTNYLSLATRNITDFEDRGIELINPFE
jgi:predicted nucleic acid-binding protein